MNSHFFSDGKLLASLLLCGSLVALAPNAMNAQGRAQTSVVNRLQPKEL